MESVGVQAKTPAAGNKGSGTAQGGNPDAKMRSPPLGDNKEFGSDKSCCPACLIPLKYVGNVTTPTMLITGELDLRTPMAQTEEYYQALKLRKVPMMMK